MHEIITETKRIPSRAVETGVFVSIAASSSIHSTYFDCSGGLTALLCYNTYIAQAVSAAISRGRKLYK